MPDNFKSYIAVVDDSPVIQRVISLMLRNAGYAVETFSDVRSAMEAFENICPDVVITDYNMPDGGGFELCAMLRNDPRTVNVPVLMVTGREHQIDPEMIKAARIYRVIGKPFSPRQLLGDVNEILSAANV